MSLTVLNVAYPFAPVGPDAVGGAEQVISTLDAALVAAGHNSLVLACESSTVCGDLIGTRLPSGPFTAEVCAAWRAALRTKLDTLLRSERIDVVHFHGVDFASYEPQSEVPELCTLHLPPEWYPSDVFSPRAGRYLHCVTSAQRKRCPPDALLLDDIPNGVDLDRFVPTPEKDDYALLLARICPEKGIHLALDAAKSAGVPLLIGGHVFPYPEHERYFEREVLPRLDAERRFIGVVEKQEKAQLLARARCLVVASTVHETSSLVAMEALAAGTPVVAFRRGALADLIAHGETGFLADSPRELVEGLRAAARLSAQTCRRQAEQRHAAERMTQRYLAVYAALAGRGAALRLQRACIRSGAPPQVELAVTPELRVEELRSASRLEAIRPSLAALWERCPTATVFQSATWLLGWYAQLCAGELRVLVCWRGARLVGIAPFFVWSSEGSRVLSLAGAGVSDYQDVLFEAAETRSCLRALERWLNRHEAEWNRLEWSELPEGSPLLRIPVQNAVRDEISTQDVCPGIALGDGAMPLERVIPRGQWQRVRYARRHAERDLGLSIEAARPETFESLFSALERLHERRWTARGEPGVLADTHVSAFHRSVARRLLEADRLVLCGVRLGGELAAVSYAFRDPGATRSYLNGFEPRFGKYSPGLLALAHVIETAAADGSSSFDFLRGAEPYKYAWGASDRARIQRRTAELASSPSTRLRNSNTDSA